MVPYGEEKSVKEIYTWAKVLKKKRDVTKWMGKVDKGNLTF